MIRNRWVPILVAAWLAMDAVAGLGVSMGGMNPSAPMLIAVEVGGITLPDNRLSVLCVACHTENPSNATLDNAGLGSHFIYRQGYATQMTQIEKVDAWAGTGALSRYGRLSDNTSVTGTAGELICESCHNMRVNSGIYKLVTTDNETLGDSALCEGCHGDTGAGHHPLTGEMSSIHGREVSNADTLFVRNPPVTGSEATYPEGGVINCRSCHKAHDGQTQAGARILKRGWKGTLPAGGAIQGQGTEGLERQSDMEPGTRLVTEFGPLCDACHKANDNPP